jgi:2-hydroxymuconate-semialdehyde hydrolase
LPTSPSPPRELTKNSSPKKIYTSSDFAAVSPHRPTIAVMNVATTPRAPEPTEPAVIMTEQMVVDGLRSLVHQTGGTNDRTVLFLHGSGPGATALSNWRLALPTLGQHRHCVTFDLAGFGDSLHPGDTPHGVTEWLEVWTAQVLGVMDRLAIERTDLVANSLGAAVALHLLCSRPDRFDRVVLMGAVGPPFQITAQLDRAWGFYDEPTLGRINELMALFTFDPAVLGEDPDRLARDRLEFALDPERRRNYSAMFPAPRQEQLDDLALDDLDWPEITHPVLLLHGRDDVVVPLQTSLFLLEQLSDVQLHVFSQCRHWVQVERAAAFHSLVLDFLEGEI